MWAYLDSKGQICLIAGPRTNQVAEEPIENPRFGQEPGIAQQLGVMLTFDAPAWVLERAGFVRDADIGDAA